MPGAASAIAPVLRLIATLVAAAGGRDRKRTRDCASASPCGENGVDIASCELAGPRRMTRPNDVDEAGSARPGRHIRVLLAIAEWTGRFRWALTRHVT
jgi:hypothetical protein